MSRKWHSGWVDFFRTRLSSDSFIRPYAKQVVEDFRTLLRSGRSWREQAQKPFDILGIEPTNICNANCIFCAYQYQSRLRPGKGFMQHDLYEKALHDFTEMVGSKKSEHTISFTPLVGEALVDPNIIRKISQAKKAGFQVMFFTNAIAFGRIDLEAFLEAKPDHVIISASPFNETSHNLLFRSHKYGRLLNGLNRLLVMRNESQSPLTITILFRANIPLGKIIVQPDFTEFIQPHLRPEEMQSLYVQMRSFDSWGGLIQQQDLVDGMQLARAPILKHRPCRWTFGLLVLYDGTVRACLCRFAGREGSEQGDALCVGDLREESLSDIWQGDRLKKLRERFVARDLPNVCRTCTMYRSV